jgi:RNA polymerase sigma-70 factor, ECF subfamily
LRGDGQEKEWALLMRAGNAGDADSYRRLLLQLTPVLRAVARRALANAGMADTDAEDVVQETLPFISSGKAGTRMRRLARGFGPSRAIK